MSLEENDMTTKLGKTALLAALLAGSLTLAGCGGSDDKAKTDPPEKTALETALEAQKAAEEAQAKAEAEKKKADEALQAEKDRQEEEKRKAAATDARKAAMALQKVLDVLDNNALVKPGHANAKHKSVQKVPSTGQPFKEKYNDPDIVVDATDANMGFTIKIDNNQTKLIEGAAFSTDEPKTHGDWGDPDSDGQAKWEFKTSGKYHGVSGEYMCTDDDKNGCTSEMMRGTTANPKEMLKLGGDWTFKPSNPAAKVADGKAAEYGWWAKETGGTVSEAHVFYNKDAAIVDFEYALGGTAKYSGNAVGQYAIHRGPTSETDDSGAFTADAMLEAKFSEFQPTVTGTIDNFTGADGKSRAWSVELKKLDIDANDGTFTHKDKSTVWSMGDSAAAASGFWKGALYGGAEKRQPTVAAGAFKSDYGNIGTMIGAFGAEKD
jgi:hypothetical protein